MASPPSIRAVASIPTPTIVAESNYDEGGTETVVSGPNSRFTSVSRDGERTQSFVGRPSQGEENVQAALHRLRDTLNHRADTYVWTEHVGHDHAAVDGTLSATDGREIECQVTRAERSTLSTRGRHGAAKSHKSPEELAANVIEAVESKLPSADPAMFLVLDANDAPAYTDEPGVALRAQVEIKQRGYGSRWREIWLIGPTVERTWRLDSDSVD